MPIEDIIRRCGPQTFSDLQRRGIAESGQIPNVRISIGARHGRKYQLSDLLPTIRAQRVFYAPGQEIELGLRIGRDTLLALRAEIPLGEKADKYVQGIRYATTGLLRNRLTGLDLTLTVACLHATDANYFADLSRLACKRNRLYVLLEKNSFVAGKNSERHWTGLGLYVLARMSENIWQSEHMAEADRIYSQLAGRETIRRSELTNIAGWPEGSGDAYVELARKAHRPPKFYLMGSKWQALLRVV
ncbi:MAG: hypothetical protein AABX75_03220 [Nanoarchaeota archaeon]